MPSARPILLIAILPLLAPASTLGFDPRAVDMIGYRLGMTEAEVVGILDHQGFGHTRVHRDAGPCPADPKQHCPSTIEAHTKDGALSFTFSPTGTPAHVTRIDYTFDARKPGAAEAVARSVLARYGPPTTLPGTLGPMTWCDRRNAEERCPADAPRLIFQPGAGPAPVLTLMSR